MIPPIATGAELLLLGVLLFITVKSLFITNRGIEGEKPKGFSLVIPFRNEERNLYSLLLSLSKQKLSIPYEVILVNDNSTDGFEKEIKKARHETEPLSLQVIPLQKAAQSELTSKQQAMDLGVSHARYDWLIFTDADMEFDPLWLQSLYQSSSTQNPFVFGRTTISPTQNLFSLFQALQLDFLFATAWLFAKANVESSCMGNNIAISKELYLSLGGQKGIGHSIVEDKKLLSLVRKRGVSPKTATPFSALAITKPVETISSFLHQMIRWIKGGMGESLFIAVVTLLFGTHLALTGVMLYQRSTITPWQMLLFTNWLYMGILFSITFYKTDLLKRVPLLPIYFILALVEVIILIPSLIFIKPKWKGRKL